MRKLDVIRYEHIIRVSGHFCPAIIKNNIVVPYISQPSLDQNLCGIEKQRFGNIAS
jgi:hypothetical protein